MSALAMVHPAAIAVIAIGVNQDAAAGVRGAQAAGFAGEAAEDDGVDHTEAGAGQHGDRQPRDHGHVDGDAIALFQAGEIAEHGGDFVDAAMVFLKGDDGVVLVFGFRNEDKAALFLCLARRMHAIVAGVRLAADEPFPERRIVGVQSGVPILIPMQELGILRDSTRGNSSR